MVFKPALRMLGSAAALMSGFLFPRTPSGKIDRRSLPRPEGKRPDVTASYVAPKSDLERTICSLSAKLWTTTTATPRQT